MPYFCYLCVVPHNHLISPFSKCTFVLEMCVPHFQFLKKNCKSLFTDVIGKHSSEGQRSEKTLRSLLPECEDSGFLQLEIRWIWMNAMQGNSDGVEIKYQTLSHPDGPQNFTVTFCACVAWWWHQPHERLSFRKAKEQLNSYWVSRSHIRGFLFSCVTILHVFIIKVIRAHFEQECLFS